MGLAAPRKRVKLSHDPNNTKWTRDTGGFGHRIMTAQGWQPGDTLGAKNASHAEFHTAANTSHIRVFVKDDNLGLGAKKGSGLAEGECTGLDVFQSILGRLNGKDEGELMKEKKSREDLKRAIYTERRWGSVRFVKGGFLIGDKIQELIDNEEDRIRQLAQSSSAAVPEALESDSSRTSKEQSSEKLATKGKKDKKGEKKRRKAEEQTSPTKEEMGKMGKSNQCTVPAQETFPDGLSSQRKKSKKRKQSEETEEASVSVNEIHEVFQELKKKKKKRRKEVAESEKSEQIIEGDITPSIPPISKSLASTSGSSTPQSLLSGRHAVRARNIAQKRLAVLDTASLNQIFMVKQ